jgi:hypothetical protein
LEREVRDLRRANDILKAASKSVFFATQLDGRPFDLLLGEVPAAVGPSTP